MYILDHRLFIGNQSFDIPPSTSPMIIGIYVDENFNHDICIADSEQNLIAPEGFELQSILTLQPSKEAVLKEKIESLNVMVQNNALYVGDVSLNLPEVDSDCHVHVFSVPSEYRENNIFYSIQMDGKPQEIPACSEFEYLGMYSLPATESAQVESSKQSLKKEVNEIRDKLVYCESIEYPFPDGTIDHIQIRDEKDRNNIQELFQVAKFHIAEGQPDFPMWFMPKSNNKKTMTAYQVYEMCLCLEIRKDFIFQKSWDLKSNIDAGLEVDIYSAWI